MFEGKDCRHKLYTLKELREQETAMLEPLEKAVTPKAKPRKLPEKKAVKKSEKKVVKSQKSVKKPVVKKYKKKGK